MPTQTAKKRTTKARKPAAKSKPTQSAKPMKKKAAKKNATATPMASKRGFMWKLLEQKQAQQKSKSGGPMPSANPFERVRVNAQSTGFSRFNGPRRKAA